MKKFLSIVGVAFLAALPAMAVNQANTGCGLGTMIFEGQDGKVFEILACTTNGTSANQTFAITTGTLGYQEGVTGSVDQAREFVAQNMDNLARDIAAGEGETLSTLAELMGVQDGAAFASRLQANFSTIFAADAKSDAVYAGIQGLI